MSTKDRIPTPDATPNAPSGAPGDRPDAATSEVTPPARATSRLAEPAAGTPDAATAAATSAITGAGRGKGRRRGRRGAASPADGADASAVSGFPEEESANRSRLAEGAVEPAARSLQEILDGLPVSPGVYIMRDRRGKILYIGKAASLRARVRQYFQPNTGDVRLFVPLLEGLVGDIETVLTSNEKEALLLENTLIKKHQPRFNINLRDDKSYLVLRLDPQAPWPRLEVVRRLADDGAHYFGPYHSATSCREALRVVNRHFQLRTCTDHVLGSRKRPCLQFQIKRCPAPCVLPVSREEYGDQVRDVRLFLENKNDELLAGLTGRMKEAAGRMDFERAAEVRDQIRALETTLESQRVVSRDFVDQDVVGFHREGLALELVVMNIRRGSLVGTKSFSYANQEFPDVELLSTFLGLYYDQSTVPPDEVLLPFAIEDLTLKAEWLSEKRLDRRRTEILVPQRGDRRRLVELALKNAAASFASRRNAREDAEIMLAKLQRRLRLPTLPRVIECYDVSHIQGFATVASMVVFVDGRPDKARYRTYNVRSVAARKGSASERQNDDFAAMYEVLSRRFRRAREGDAGWELPDLLVVDGGKGQLGMALAAARDVGIDTRPGTGLTIVALAKEREPAEPSATDAVARPAPPKASTSSHGEGTLGARPPDVSTSTPDAVSSPADAAEEDSPAPAPDPFVARRPERTGDAPPRPDRLFLPQVKDPIPIRPNSAEMFVLQQLRDEAHRFAVKTHRGRRGRLTLRSALGEIPGIGAKRQRLLLRHFGSLRKVREASLADILAVPGMTKSAAEAVFAAVGAGASSSNDGSLATQADARETARSAGENDVPAVAAEEAVDAAFASLAEGDEGQEEDEEVEELEEDIAGETGDEEDGEDAALPADLLETT